MAVCSMLCTDGLLLHLVGKGQLLVYAGASYGNGKRGDSIWESHHKSSAQGVRRADTPPKKEGQIGYDHLKGHTTVHTLARHEGGVQEG